MTKKWPESDWEMPKKWPKIERKSSRTIRKVIPDSDKKLPKSASKMTRKWSKSDFELHKEELKALAEIELLKKWLRSD